MKRNVTTAMAWTVGVLAVVGALALIGRTIPRHEEPPVGPVMKPDPGAGEMLVLVVGGVYATKEEADAANAQISLGDVQGYYVVPVAQFQGFREQIGEAGEFALVSAFRTEEGAQDFVTAMQSFGYPASVAPTRVRSLGGLYAGLGQEPDPNGGGPLLHPTGESLP